MLDTFKPKSKNKDNDYNQKALLKEMKKTLKEHSSTVKDQHHRNETKFEQAAKARASYTSLTYEQVVERKRLKRLGQNNFRDNDSVDPHIVIQSAIDKFQIEQA